MRDQSHQETAVIFNRHVTDVAPIHQGRSEIDNIVRTHGKEISGHELADAAVTFPPVLLGAVFSQRPLTDRFAAGLLFDHAGDEAAHALVQGAAVFHFFQ